MGDLLFDLPWGVLQDIFTCWLELQSVCKLDSAYCTTKQRARFVEICQENVVVFFNTPAKQSWDYIRWILTKQISISNVLAGLFQMAKPA